jgi:hypothetical protein
MTNLDSKILCWSDRVVAERLVEETLYIYSHETGDVFEVQGLASEFCRAVNGQKRLKLLKTKLLQILPEYPLTSSTRMSRA